MGTPLAYLRRSRVFADKPGAVSHEAQTTAIRELAARHGYQLRDEQILEDWGRSGGAGKEKHRPGYLTLRAAVTDGTVTDVFAYDLSRLTRSLVEWASLAEACARSGVRVHLVTEGTFDFGSVSGEMVANILASVAQAVRGWATERAVQTVAYRRRRGDRLGPPAYGREFVRRKDSAIVGGDDDPAAVVAAFREAGSWNGAARLLNERGVPSKRADHGGIWRALAVRRVLEREAPGLIPRNGRPGAKTRQDSRLASLLVCPCGGILTPSRRAGREAVNYRCQRAYTDPGHSRPASVSEAAIMPWMRDEIAHLRIVDAVTLATDDAAERDALAAEKARILRQNAKGYITEAELDAGMDEITAALDRLGTADVVAAVPPVDWEWPVPELNAYLRAILVSVDLGPDMRPVSALWRNRAMRRPD
jgi:DNA invertase Pin-like site-specific DNA recombinase